MLFRLLFALLITFGCFGQTLLRVDQYVTTERSDKRRTTPTSDVSFQQNLFGKVGMFAWGQASPTYRQTYAGASYQFTSWLQAGVGGGIEQADSMARLGSFLYMSKGTNSFSCLYENGGSGPWHSAVYNHRIAKGRFGVGIFNQTRMGTGPRAEVNFGPIKVWTAPLWENGGHNVRYGVRYTYLKSGR
jgi:hypothetical protein